MIFTIKAQHPMGAKAASGASRVFTYDNQRNVLQDVESGYVYQSGNQRKPGVAVRSFSAKAPLTKSGRVRLLKIQLGLSCNYSCSYCSQRFVEPSEETTSRDIATFLRALDHLQFSPERGLKIEFWGGEPFVYWKTMKPLAEALIDRFKMWPVRPRMSVITNGSILTPEICDWLVDMGFSMAISHDGPGQATRGPDPFEDPEKKALILDLYRRLKPLSRISFNAMMHKDNLGRKRIRDWFVALTGDDDVPLGEGHLIDAYDADGLALMLEGEQHYAYRREAFNDLCEHKGGGFIPIAEKIEDFIRRVSEHIPARELGQKCGMDRDDTIALDLRGNIITCQNTSAVATAPNGRPHLAGNVLAGIGNARVAAATHWSERPHCTDCPMLHLCQGSCMYLEGERWFASCDNAYSDAVPMFAAAFQAMTGYIPVLIEAEGLPAHRRDLWGTVLKQSHPAPQNLSVPEAAE